jgi:hypothetical protein
LKENTLRDWVIVGSGLIGTALALYIKSEITDNLTIIDPHGEPLAQWTNWAMNCGMQYMRSPASHSLSTDFHDLWRYVRSLGEDPMAVFLPPNKRPSLRHFLQHSKELIRRISLDEHYVQAKVQDIDSVSGYWALATDQGAEFKSRKVLLTLGGRQSPRIPGFCSQLPWNAVHPLIGPRLPDELGARVLVVGGGISGVQKCLALAVSGRRVFLLTEGATRVSLYDHRVGFNGPKRRGELMEVEDVALLKLIQSNKLTGTVTPDLLEELNREVIRGRVSLLSLTEEPSSGEIETGPEGISLLLGARKVQVDAVLIAAGFEERVPQNPLIQKLMVKGFPAEMGYPRLNQNLSWQPNLYLAGAMAELRIGPRGRQSHRPSFSPPKDL